MSDSRPRSFFWPVANLLALLATLAVNGLANALPLNGIPTGDVINRDPIPFQPANWVFAIWGLIYLLLAAFVGYGLTPPGRRDPRVRAVSPLFVLSCLANCVWLFLWHYEQLHLSILVMAGLLFSLIAIYGRLPAGLLRVPFSVYLGWISVATIANASVLLDRAGWDGWGIAPEQWAVVMVLVGAGLATALSLAALDPFFVAVFVWAYAGIALRPGTPPEVATVATWTAVALGVLTLVVAVLGVVRRSGGGRPVGGAVDRPQGALQVAER